jgi:hypothetical protein
MHTVAITPSRRAVFFAGIAWALAVAPAQATIYKCDGTDGTPVYQDSPCPAGRELRDFDKDPPQVSVMPLVPSPPAPRTREAPAAAAGGKAKTAPKSKASAATASNAAARKFLVPGINEGEVLARLGPPDMKNGGGGRKVTRWTYLPAPEDLGTVTALTFENGRLVEVERKIVH